MIIKFSKEVSLGIYISIFLISGVLLIGINKYNSRFVKLRYFTSMSLLVILSTLRYGVGTDFFTYRSIFQRLSKMTLKEYIDINGINEMGVYVLNKFAGLLGGFSGYLFLTSTIIIGCTYYVIYREREKISIAVGLILFLFLDYTMSFNIINQCIAVSIIFIGYRFIIEKNIIKFLIVILIAALFHSTAILIFPVYFLWNKRREGLIHPILLIIFLIILILVIVNYQKVIDFISTFNGMEAYKDYIYTDNRGKNRDLIIKILILIICSLRYKKLVCYDNNNKLYILMLFISVIISFTGFTSPFVKRVGLYFSIVEILILPSFIETFKSKKEKRLLSYCAILSSILLFILVSYILGQGHVIPYRIMI